MRDGFNPIRPDQQDYYSSPFSLNDNSLNSVTATTVNLIVEQSDLCGDVIHVLLHAVIVISRHRLVELRALHGLDRCHDTVTIEPKRGGRSCRCACHVELINADEGGLEGIKVVSWLQLLHR
jgi:hypothetical protein